jgi:hypothetical protein
MAARLILRRALAALGALALAAAPVHGEGRPRYGGVVTGALLGEPAGFDPVAARTAADVAVIALVFDTLYRVGPDGRIAPHLAAALPEVINGKSRIAIRPGAHFHNGAALGAADVAASLARVKDAPAGWLLAGIDDIAVDGDAVVLGTTRKDLAQLLAAPATAITPRGLAPRPTAPIGSGPFRLAGSRKDRLELDAYAEHFAGRAYLDHVTLRWFTAADGEARLYETGGSDWSLRGATAFAHGTPKHPTVSLDAPATLLVYLGFGGRARAHHRQPRLPHRPRGRPGPGGPGRGRRRRARGADPRSIPVDLGGPALGEAERVARLPEAQAALAAAAGAVPALAPARIGAVSLEILVDASRPDDREIAERVVIALDKLGLAATIAAVAAPDLARRIAAAGCDLYIGQLALQVATPVHLFAAAYAAGGEREVAVRLAAGPSIDLVRARGAFTKRWPIVPLVHRGVRLHLRRDLRGAAFEPSARLGIAELFRWSR